MRNAAALLRHCRVQTQPTTPARVVAMRGIASLGIHRPWLGAATSTSCFSASFLHATASLPWLQPRLAPGGVAGGITGVAWGSVREKQTKRQSYSKPARASPCGQRMTKKAHIGIKACAAEYVVGGRLICKQRKYIAKNPGVSRHRHFKLYPGVNVKVMKNTSLQAMVSGRVKMTHDVVRDVMIMNVLPEPREELLREDTWRYRTEHIETLEENTVLCNLRSKALPAFGKEGGWINQPVGVKPMKVRISHGKDTWNNPAVKDPLEIEPFAYPLPRAILARHIKKVRRRHAGVPDAENDPEFSVTDTRFHLFHGQSAQR